VRSGRSGDVSVMAKSKRPANSLFWKILPVSPLSAIFYRVQGVSRSDKSSRIKNLAELAQKKIIGMNPRDRRPEVRSQDAVARVGARGQPAPSHSVDQLALRNAFWTSV
jgi:hypothetical protein